MFHQRMNTKLPFVANSAWMSFVGLDMMSRTIIYNGGYPRKRIDHSMLEERRLFKNLTIRRFSRARLCHSQSRMTHEVKFGFTVLRKCGGGKAAAAPLSRNLSICLGSCCIESQPAHFVQMYGLNPLLRGSLQSKTRSILRAGWVCSSCRARPIPKASYSVETKSKKPFYVTTPIFYVNAGKSE